MEPAKKRGPTGPVVLNLSDPRFILSRTLCEFKFTRGRVGFRVIFFGIRNTPSLTLRGRELLPKASSTSENISIRVVLYNKFEVRETTTYKYPSPAQRPPRFPYPRICR